MENRRGPSWACQVAGDSRGQVTSRRDSGVHETMGGFSPSQRVVRGEEDSWIDLRLGFCQTSSVAGQWDRGEEDIGKMTSMLGGEGVDRVRDCMSQIPDGVY